MGASAGRVLLISKGDWNAQTTYTGLDMVRHNGATWVCKNTCTNIEPTEKNSANWQLMARDSKETKIDDALSLASTNPVQNKVVTQSLIDIKKETTVNLLNPTLQTTTQNGVTCTNNGDGTYTLNGTATEQTAFWMNFNNYLDISKLDAETDYKIICTPYGGKNNTYRTDFKINETLFGSEYAEISRVYKGKEFDISGYLVIVIAPGYTCDNLVFKPMITTNLSATYDDFVPYTGDTGKLNGDVAALKAYVDKAATIFTYKTKAEYDAAVANDEIPDGAKVIKDYDD